ncbi:MAG: 1-acyl-sn-glycerol-3-phosphate acyltransferase [Candidatus Rokubacteria bacterium]|nr:1-acyl-sn-glycerol-3-phosphate acyltransferase [Candidatus Rokubacteria bacterium]
MLYAILKPIALAIMRLLFRLEGRGMERVPRQGPVLLVANHSSFLDPPLVGGVTPRPLSFMAKAELFAVPGLGALIRRLNARPVRREGSDAGALRTALRILQEGGALLMFPEGTRGPEGRLRDPMPGAAMLAVLSGAQVVPVFIRGSGRAWPRGQTLPRPAKVTVTFGAPQVFGRRDAEGRKIDYEAVSREMMAMIGGLAGVDAVGRQSGGSDAGARHELTANSRQGS